MNQTTFWPFETFRQTMSSAPSEFVSPLPAMCHEESVTAPMLTLDVSVAPFMSQIESAPVP